MHNDNDFSLMCAQFRGTNFAAVTAIFCKCTRFRDSTFSVGSTTFLMKLKCLLQIGTKNKYEMLTIKVTTKATETTFLESAKKPR
jgi:hypothetical protein